MKIALAGNPNSGKTSLFNALTGKLEYVGNWSGVTVSKKEIKLKKEFGDASVVDLPGAYSISPYTSEESITVDFVKGEDADVIVNVIDISNLSRSLYFTTQLLELSMPMVVALNKNDMLSRLGDKLDIEKLESYLGVKVITISAEKNQNLDTLLKEATSAECPSFSKEFSDDASRFSFIDEILQNVYITKSDRTAVTTADRVDKVLVSKIFGLPIFLGVMWLVFYLSQNLIGGFFSEYINETLFGELIPDFLNASLESLSVNPLLQSMIVDGAVAGVGAVLGFIPLIMVLFFLLSLLEDCGYMSRVAVVMDVFFKKIGLSGKSIIPMVVGTGCAIPGIMATRTIENENERKRLCILTPFIPCGAKLPVIALLAAAFFPTASWIGPSIYIIALAVIFIVGLILKKIFTIDTDQSVFILELPAYKVPRLSYAVKNMFDKAKAFVVKAGTIILVCNTAIWILQTYDFSFRVVEDANTSMIAILGSLLIPIFIPLGFATWQLISASVTGFIAKENVVGTLAVMLIVSEDLLHSTSGPLSEMLTPVTAFAFLVFNLFTPPCFAAIGAMNSEMGSRKWLAIGIAVQLTTGYTLALLVNQIGTLITTGVLAQGFIPAIIFLVVLILFIVKMMKNQNIKKSIMVRS